MKNKLASLLFLCCSFSRAAIAIVDGGAAHACVGGPNTVTTASINTTGATLIVVLSINYSGAPSQTISDSKSNTWTALNLEDSGFQTQGRFFYSASPTVGTGHTFTNTTSGSFPAICVVALSGVKLTSPLDAQAAGTAGTTPISPGSITPAGDNEVFITGLGDRDTGVPTITSPFSPVIDTIAYAAGVHWGAGLGVFIQTTAAAQNPTWTLTGAGSGMLAIMATFKPTATSTVRHRVLSN